MNSESEDLRYLAARVARTVAGARDRHTYPLGRAERPAALQAARAAGRELARVVDRGFVGSQDWCTRCWTQPRGDHGVSSDPCTLCFDCCDPDSIYDPE